MFVLYQLNLFRSDGLVRLLQKRRIENPISTYNIIVVSLRHCNRIQSKKAEDLIGSSSLRLFLRSEINFLQHLRGVCAV